MRRILLLTLCFVLLLPASAGAQDVAGDLLGRINGLRASLGLHPYTINAALSAAAQDHASWMADSGQISHTQPDGSTPRTRAQAAGYGSSWVSENIYMGTRATVDDAWQFWMNSSIHYRGMTSDHYYNIGIASASGANGTAFVLVFGNPNTTVRVAPPVTVPESDPYNFRGQGSTAAGESAAPSLPPFVVGIDEAGNILHEVQPGQTLGDIILIYGYDWPDLQRVRDLNGFSEPEGRNLTIGQVIKIPPWEGTFTPTAPPPNVAPEQTAEPVSENGQDTTPTSSATPTSTPQPQMTLTPSVPTSTPDTPAVASAGITPTVPAAVSAEITPTNTPLPPAEADEAEAAWSAVTFTPAPSSSADASAGAASSSNAPAAGATAVAVAGSPGQQSALNPGQSPAESGTDGPPTLLIIAIVVQVAVLLGVGFAYWQYGRRRA
ncbi:MAG: CAP domain-containing protein [Chloroflexota bacterium]